MEDSRIRNIAGVDYFYAWDDGEMVRVPTAQVGGGTVGTYANVAALQAAFPAATNIGKHATVNGVDYVSNGVGSIAAWEPANADRSWGITKTDTLESVVLSSGAPTLAVSAVGAATSIAGSTTVSAPGTVFEYTPNGGILGGVIAWPDASPIQGTSNYARVLIDSLDFEWVVNCNPSQPLNVRVGGKYAAAALLTTGASAGVYRIRCTFGSKVTREVELQGLCENAVLQGITLLPTDTIQNPNNTNREKWGIVTDSMGVGGVSYNGPSNAGAGSFVGVAMAALGIKNYTPLTIGGTGYIAGGSQNSQTTIPAKMTPLAPTRLLIVHGYNDRVASTQAAITTAAAKVYDDFHTALPSSKIIAVTALNAQNGTDNATPAIIAAASTRPWVSVVDASGWIVGTGYAGATTGVGNRDFIISADNIHPGPYGLTYLGQRLAQAILSLRNQTP